MKIHDDDFENAKKNKMLDRWGYAFFLYGDYCNCGYNFGLINPSLSGFQTLRGIKNTNHV